MNKSENIGKLTEALSKAQSVIKGAITDSENPFFRSRYADLSSVWVACRKPLTDNGLAILQTGLFIPEHPEMVAIETTMSHSSGEFVTGVMAGKPVKNDPQSIGSCVTYLRRYSLAAICGISPEDDDGNAATGETPKKPPKTSEPNSTKVYGLKMDKNAPQGEPEANSAPYLKEVERILNEIAPNNNKAKVELCKKVFGEANDSWERLKECSWMVLKAGIPRLQVIQRVPENTLANIEKGNIIIPPDDAA